MEKFGLLVSAEELGSRPAVTATGRVMKWPHRPDGVGAEGLRRLRLLVPGGVPSLAPAPWGLQGNASCSYEEQAAGLGHIVPTETPVAAKP